MSGCPSPGIHRNTGGSSVHTQYLWAGWTGWCCAQMVNWCPEGASCPRWAGRTDGIPGRTGTDDPPWKSSTWKVWAIHPIVTFSLKEAKVWWREKLTVHDTRMEVTESVRGSCSWTATSPSSLCTCLWSTPWPVGLTSEDDRHAHSQFNQRLHRDCGATASQPTLSSNWLRDGTWVTEAVSIDGSHDEQVNRVGLKAADCVSFDLDHVRYCLPRAAGWLAANQWRKTLLVINGLNIIKGQACNMQ